MMMCKELLQARELPALPVASSQEEWETLRQKMLHTLCEVEYGAPVPAPKKLTAQVLAYNPRCFAGKAVFTRVLLTAEMENGSFSFPVEAVIPKSAKPVPAFVWISFFGPITNFHLPAEEVVEEGFAVFSFHYTDVTTDDNDFSTGLAGLLGPREEHSSGKLAMWAWAAMRVMDYIQELSYIDSQQVAVVGHSRLGKTALLAGALDPRFSLVISNNSGSCGAALSRGKEGEDIDHITEEFPFWFCPAYRKYAKKEKELPFDQHFLLALSAPRKVYVASAQEDPWADPVSEYLSCAAAAPAWEALGLPGFSGPDRLPAPGDTFSEGSIGYHLRVGGHDLTRVDWQKFMAFFRG